MLASVRDLLREDSSRYGGTNGRLIGGLGRYENLGPFEVWLCENVNDLADETSGDVEWGEWFARIGKWIVSTDSQGFWYAVKYGSENEARGVFQVTDEDYGAWLGSDEDEDEDEPQTDGPLRGKTVRIDGMRGVAWHVDAHDTYNEQITAHMVGDDRPFYFDDSYATEIAREDYCGECGQVGCAHDGLDRGDE